MCIRDRSKELKALYREEERYRQLLDTSMAVEGLPRHASIHAAGVVIAREPLVKHVPLLKTNDQTVVTQFPMGTLEQLGLLKMDFLGLKTLTIIEAVSYTHLDVYKRQLLLLRLNRIRTRWRRAGKKLRRRPAVTASRFNHLRERERRLD